MLHMSLCVSETLHVCCYMSDIWFLVLEVLLSVMEVVVCIDASNEGVGDAVVDVVYVARSVRYGLVAT